MLRYYNVFHISQVEGVEALEQEEIEMVEHDPIEDAECIINNYAEREIGLQIIDELGDRAFYSEFDDMIKVPLKEQFDNIEEYYSTKFHEMAHSTGSQRRLKRIKSCKFGSTPYSKEELVAELCAAILLNHCGIETEKTFKNNVAYLQSWIQALKNDKKMIVSASSKAEKAVKYILTGEVAAY